MREADVRKHEHVSRIKGWFTEAKTLGRLPDAYLAFKPHEEQSLKLLPASEIALMVRKEVERLREQGRDDDAEAHTDIMTDVVLEERGEQVTLDFVRMMGRAGETAVLGALDQWLAKPGLVPSTVAERRKFVTRLVKWIGREKRIPPELVTFDHVDRKLADRYLTSAMGDVHPATRRKHASAFASLWKWAADDRRDYFRSTVSPELRGNPWSGLGDSLGPIPKPEKRPFTDEEVRLVLQHAQGHYQDVFKFLALTGMRLSEAVTIRVASVDLANRTMKVEKGKTAAARRVVPIHSELLAMVTERVSSGTDRLFAEISLPRDPAQGPGHSVTKYMGRLRERLGIAKGEAQGRRQAPVDTHSFRRWFTRKAADALMAGATGFSPWTIAQVVGHDTEDDDLGMTMKRYAGRDSIEALSACVEAVRLPPPTHP